jgi:uncharacterized phage infection (PIP) family protein YhgE
LSEVEALAVAGRKRVGTLIIVAIILVLGAAFAVTYVQDSGTISALNQTVSSQSSLINSQLSQLDVDLAKISNLTSTITSLRSQVSSLKSGIASDDARIGSLTAGYNQANMTLASLQSQVSSLNSQIANLDAQVASLNNQIATDQSEVTSLQAQVRQDESTLTIINGALGKPLAELMDSNLTFSVSTGSEYQFQFKTNSTGGVLLVGLVRSSASNTTVSVTTPTDPVDLGSSGVAAFDVTGNATCTVDIYAQNMGSFTATVNVWFFHS